MQSGFGKPKCGLMEPWARGQAAIDPLRSPPPSSHLFIGSAAEEGEGTVGGGGGIDF